MNINFRGWRREVYTHKKTVARIEQAHYGSRPTFVERTGDLVWSSASVAYGKLDNLGLTGDFLLEMHFSQDELESWLSEFVKEKPEESIRLLARLQAEAILALNQVNSSERDNDS